MSVDTRQIRIAAVGDHLLAGAGDPRAIGWWGRVLARTSAPQVSIENYVLAVPHETTEELGERWWAEASRRFSSDVENRLVVALSDADLDVDASSSARSRLNLANVLDTASQRSIPVLVVGPTPGLDDERNDRLAELNAAYADVAARRNHLYVDAFTPLRSHEQWRSDLAAGQGVPGQAGHGLIAWLVLHRGWYQWLGVPEPTA
nr:GDSL-type esterase/lipase family protein [Micrococcus cohnii]